MAHKHGLAITNVLSQKYNKDIGDGFWAYYEEHEFDDESIAIDLEDNEEAALILQLLELFSDKSNHYNKQKPTATVLCSLLMSICNETYIADPLSSFHGIHVFDTSYTDKDLNDIYKEVESQCNDILPRDATQDKNLLIVLYLGKKHNISLLTYLTDSYHRFVIKQPMNHNVRTSDWIKHCTNNLQSDIHSISQQSNGKQILEIYTSAINSYCNRMVHTPWPQLQYMYKINDCMDDIAFYILHSYEFIANYLSRGFDSQLPQLLPTMIDFWIVPKNVQFNAEEDDDDEYDDDPDDDDEHELKQNDNMEFGVDIKERLKYIKDDNKLVYDHVKPLIVFGRTMIASGFKTLVKERNQRICMILKRQPNKTVDKDKKNISSKLFNRKRKSKNDLDDSKTMMEDDGDRLFMYYLNKDLNVSSFDGSSLAPSLISNSKQCLLPDPRYDGKPMTKKVYKYNKHIGAFHKQNGYQFTLSFHIYAEGDVRVYFYHNGFMVRFVPSDVITLLPKFFKNPKYSNNGKDIKKFVKKLMDNKSLSDRRFTRFYQSFTGYSLHEDV